LNQNQSPETGINPWSDPQRGVTVIPAPAPGRGNWAGGHSLWREPTSDALYLYYRLRLPREAPEAANRGGQGRIAVSRGGGPFETVWSATKADFDANSIEKAALCRAADGRWRLYISYESRATGHWQIDLMEADDPAKFDPSTRRVFLHPGDLGAADIKDPVFVSHRGREMLFANYILSEVREATLRADLDCGGAVTHITRAILEPEPSGWDGYSCRLTGVLPLDGETIFFYDGNESLARVCEESCGYAVAASPLEKPRKVTLAEPACRGTRYVDAVRLTGQHGEVAVFCEFTLPDGSHELRRCPVVLGQKRTADA
jgi:hypothetical protein